MGKVVASLRLLPAEAETNLEALKKALAGKLPSGVRIYKFEEEPIAFGLKALIAHLILPETQAGKMEEVEEAVKKVEGVGEVEVLMVRRF
jgi:elongation factor 1-beta